MLLDEDNFCLIDLRSLITCLLDNAGIHFRGRRQSLANVDDWFLARNSLFPKNLIKVRISIRRKEADSEKLNNQLILL